MSLQQAIEANRGLVYLIQHAPDSTPVVEVAALIALVAQKLEDASAQLERSCCKN